MCPLAVESGVGGAGGEQLFVASLLTIRPRRGHDQLGAANRLEPDDYGGEHYYLEHGK